MCATSAACNSTCVCVDRCSSRMAPGRCSATSLMIDLRWTRVSVSFVPEESVRETRHADRRPNQPRESKVDIWQHENVDDGCDVVHGQARETDGTPQRAPNCHCARHFGRNDSDEQRRSIAAARVTFVKQVGGMSRGVRCGIPDQRKASARLYRPRSARRPSPSSDRTAFSRLIAHASMADSPPAGSAHRPDRLPARRYGTACP